MKVSPSQYAVALIQSAKSDNLGILAKKFWHLLQKNKQYRDLPKILEDLEIEAAKAEGKTIVSVISEKPLNNIEIEQIKTQLLCHPECQRRILQDSSASPQNDKNNKIIVRNIVRQGTTGIIVKIEDKIIDLTAESKINRLKQVL